MIIVIGGQKGGTGKSTLSINLAVALVLAGHKTLLVDTDSQRSSSNWSDVRELNPELPAVVTLQKTGKLDRLLPTLAKDYEHLVVDSGGRDSLELRSALLAADRLIIPIRPSQIDLWTLDPMSELVDGAAGLNERLLTGLLLTMVPTNPAIRELDDARALVGNYPSLGVFQSVIHERKAYRDAVFRGKGVLEHSDPKAAAEIRNFIQEIFPREHVQQTATA